MTTLTYITRISSAKAHKPCSCCLISSRFLPLCRFWRGQECKTEEIIAPRNGDVKVWDPSANKAHPPRQRYEPLAKARTTPLARIPQRGAQGTNKRSIAWMLPHAQRLQSANQTPNGSCCRPLGRW